MTRREIDMLGVLTSSTVTSASSLREQAMKWRLCMTSEQRGSIDPPPLKPLSTSKPVAFVRLTLIPAEV